MYDSFRNILANTPAKMAEQKEMAMQSPIAIFCRLWYSSKLAADEETPLPISSSWVRRSRWKIVNFPLNSL